MVEGRRFDGVKVFTATRAKDREELKGFDQSHVFDI